MVTSSDQPSLQAVYKLVAVEEAGRAVRGVAKRSAGKRTAPGTKQVWRRRSADGGMVEDLIATAGAEPGQGAWEPLLEPWITAGRLSRALPSLVESREYARRQLACLPAGMRGNAGCDPYPVRLGSAPRGPRRAGA